jgi:hypothetical protein
MAHELPSPILSLGFSRIFHSTTNETQQKQRRAAKSAPFANSVNAALDG